MEYISLTKSRCHPTSNTTNAQRVFARIAAQVAFIFSQLRTVDGQVFLPKCAQTHANSSISVLGDASGVAHSTASISVTALNDTALTATISLQYGSKRKSSSPYTPRLDHEVIIPITPKLRDLFDTPSLDGLLNTMKEHHVYGAIQSTLAFFNGQVYCAPDHWDDCHYQPAHKVDIPLELTIDEGAQAVIGDLAPLVQPIVTHSKERIVQALFPDDPIADSASIVCRASGTDTAADVLPTDDSPWVYSAAIGGIVLLVCVAFVGYQRYRSCSKRPQASAVYSIDPEGV